MGLIRGEADGGIGWLTIDNVARRNALSMGMYESIPGVVALLANDPGVRVIVLRGAGSQAFSAGSNVSEFAELRHAGNWEAYAADEHEAHAAILNAPMPVVAAIRGDCRGGGLALALCADIRVAADDAMFAIPPGKLGAGYPVDGLEVLARTIGVGRAKHLVLSAETIDAHRAEAIGLINEVVPETDFDSRIYDLVGTMANLAPLPLRAAKMALSDMERHPNDRDPDRSQRFVRACYESDDYAEGVAAFSEKRAPRFMGN